MPLMPLAPRPLLPTAPLPPVWTIGGWSKDVKCDWLDHEDQLCNWLLKHGYATWLWGDDGRTWNAGLQRFLPPMLRIAPFEADYGGLIWFMLLVRFLAVRGEPQQQQQDCLGRTDCYYSPDGGTGGSGTEYGRYIVKMTLLVSVFVLNPEAGLLLLLFMVFTGSLELTSKKHDALADYTRAHAAAAAATTATATTAASAELRGANATVVESAANATRAAGAAGRATGLSSLLAAGRGGGASGLLGLLGAARGSAPTGSGSNEEAQRRFDLGAVRLLAFLASGWTLMPDWPKQGPKWDTMRHWSRLEWVPFLGHYMRVPLNKGESHAIAFLKLFLLLVFLLPWEVMPFSMGALSDVQSGALSISTLLVIVQWVVTLGFQGVWWITGLLYGLLVDALIFVVENLPRPAPDPPCCAAAAAPPSGGIFGHQVGLGAPEPWFDGIPKSLGVNPLLGNTRLLSSAAPCAPCAAAAAATNVAAAAASNTTSATAVPPPPRLTGGATHNALPHGELASFVARVGGKLEEEAQASLHDARAASASWSGRKLDALSSALPSLPSLEVTLT